MAKLSSLLSLRWLAACAAVSHDHGLTDMLALDMDQERGSEGYPTQILRLTRFIDAEAHTMEQANLQAIVAQLVDQFAVWHYG